MIESWVIQCWEIREVRGARQKRQERSNKAERKESGVGAEGRGIPLPGQVREDWSWMKGFHKVWGRWCF